MFEASTKYVMHAKIKFPKFPSTSRQAFESYESRQGQPDP